jgi:hypothetical protein
MGWLFCFVAFKEESGLWKEQAVLDFSFKNICVMKKVKVMLTVIAVMAVVGGALAFKARSYAGIFCTKQINDGPGFCQGWYIGKLATVAHPGNFYYTTPTHDWRLCSVAAVNCNISTSMTMNEFP